MSRPVGAATVVRAAPGCRRRHRQGTIRDGREAGTASIVFPMVLWLATLATVALVDVGAYLTAVARAQALADAAALAAVAADVDGAAGPAGRAGASRVAAAGGGRVEACRCPVGTGHATVEVSVEASGLALPRLGVHRVSAEASAVLTDGPGGDPPAWTAAGRDGQPPDPAVPSVAR